MSRITIDRADLEVLYRIALTADVSGATKADEAAVERILLALAAPPTRTPVCAEHGCGTSIEFVPTSGWGATGEWRHVNLPSQPGHMARPRVFVSPPRIPEGFLGA